MWGGTGQGRQGRGGVEWSGTGQGGVGWIEVGWDRTGWDRTGWGRMGCDMVGRSGWDMMGWDRTGRGARPSPQSVLRQHEFLHTQRERSRRSDRYGSQIDRCPSPLGAGGGSREAEQDCGSGSGRDRALSTELNFVLVCPRQRENGR